MPASAKQRPITQEDIARAQLFLEYKYNPIKWMEECAYLPTPGGDQLVKLYEPQKRVIESFYRDHHLVLLKSRQTGFSTLSQLIVAHTTTFYDNAVCGIVSRDGSEASDFNRKVIDILDKQPKWLQKGFHFKNAQSFKMKNGSQLWASAISPANPGSVFRGKSISLLIIDEAAHIRYIDEAWTAMAPTLSKAQLAAEKNGMPFGTIILSTPNRTEGIGKWFFDMWKNSTMNPDGVWKPHKIYWREIPEFVNNPTWYQKQCEILGNNKNKIAQELELKFVPIEGLFPEDIYEKLQEIKSKPLQIIKVSESSFLNKYKEISPERYHLIGVDTASEFGEDYSAIQVVDYITMEQVMEFHGKLKVSEFVKTLKFVAQLFPKHLLIIENNSYGNQVCEELHNDENNSHLYNIYGTWKAQPVPNPNISRSYSKHRSSRPKRRIFQLGLTTTAKTRPLIFDALYTLICENPYIVKSEKLALELLSLVHKSNRIEADTGSNDDLAMAFAFCCYARLYLKESVQNRIQLDDMDNYNNSYGMTEGNINVPYQQQQQRRHWMFGFNSVNDAPLADDKYNKLKDIFGINIPTMTDGIGYVQKTNTLLDKYDDSLIDLFEKSKFMNG